MKTIRPLAIVALLKDIPSHGLVRGQVGTVLETLKPGVYEVEFSGDDGRAYASVALRGEQLIALHYQSKAA